ATQWSSWTAPRSWCRSGTGPSSRRSTGSTCASTCSRTSTLRLSRDERAASAKGSDAPMMRSMFAAISGLKTHQIMMDVTANDIAKVNTIGYKSSRTTFKDSLSQLQKGGAGQGPGQGGSNPAQVGLGTQLGSIDSLMQSGALQSTGNTLDLAIQGEGW